MALVGQVGEYVNGTEDIASYIERVELYFAVPKLPQRKVSKGMC